MNFIHRLMQNLGNEPESIEIRKNDIHDQLNNIIRHMELLKTQRQNIDRQIEMFANLHNDLTSQLTKFNK
jgi:peptidoglycan hydrolase CwlO-like protein